MSTTLDVLIANNPLKAKAFLEEIDGKNPLFICTIGTTETRQDLWHIGGWSKPRIY